MNDWTVRTCRPASVRLLGAGLIGAGLIGLCAASTVFAQPGERPPGPPDGERAREEPGPGREERGPRRIGPREDMPRDPAVVGRLIDRGIEDQRRTLARLEKAKAELEGGKPVEEVLRELREARRMAWSDSVVGSWRERQATGGAQPRLFEDGERRPDPADAERLLKFVEDVSPEFAAKLRAWRSSDQRAFESVIGRLGPKAIETFRARGAEPQLFELRKADLRATVQVLEISVELRRRKASDAAPNPAAPTTDELKATLRERVLAATDAAMRLREYEADKLSQRLEETKRRLEDAKANRDALVDRMMEELLRPAPPRRPAGGPPRPEEAGSVPP